MGRKGSRVRLSTGHMLLGSTRGCHSCWPCRPPYFLIHQTKSPAAPYMCDGATVLEYTGLYHSIEPARDDKSRCALNQAAQINNREGSKYSGLLLPRRTSRFQPHRRSPIDRCADLSRSTS